MSIKLIAFDVDGTIVADNHMTIHSKNIEALNMAHEAGAKIVMSTGRTFSLSKKEIDTIGCVDYMIGSNGAIVVDCKTLKVLKSNCIPKESAKMILDILLEYNAVFQIYADKKGYVAGYSYDNYIEAKGLPEIFLVKYRQRMDLVDDLNEVIEEKPIEKFNVDHADKEDVPIIMEKLSHIPGLVYSAGFEGNIEITCEGADKGNALAWLADQLKILPKEVMAFGDSANDVTMLSWAENSYAVANANEKAKEAARSVTNKDNNEGGVGITILENLTNMGK